MDIIFASQVNHLKLAQVFIKRNKCENICLCFFYDKRIFPEDILFQSEIDKNLFSEIELLELPVKSISPNLYKLYRVKKIVKNLYNDKKPNKIYMFSFDRIYNIFFNEGRKINAEINIIEEGLTDYFEFDEDIYKVSLERALQKIKSDFKVFKKPFLNSTKFKWPFIFPFHFSKFIINSFNNPELHMAIMKITGIHKEYFNTDKTYDNAYLSQPDKAINFKFRNYHQIDIFDYRVNKSIQKNKALFISQSYGTKEDNIIVWSYIVEILNRFYKKTGKEIEIKLHPREDKSIMDEIKKLNMNDKLKFLISEKHSVEELMLTGNYNTLIGVTSASLVYVKQKMKNIEIYSIGSELLTCLGKSAPPTLRRYVKELNLRFDIKQFRS